MRVYCVAAALALTGVTACGGGSPSSAPVGVDKDGDGFTEAAGDCNDQSAAINPNGTVVVESCFWVTPEWDCPRGSDQYPEEDDVVRVRLINNKCSTLSVTDASVQVTVREAHGTFNFAGETWTTEHARSSPNTIAMGVGDDISVDANNVCSNSRGRGAYNIYDALITLQTSAGPVTAKASNGRRVSFPFSDAFNPPRSPCPGPVLEPCAKKQRGEPRAVQGRTRG